MSDYSPYQFALLRIFAGGVLAATALLIATNGSVPDTTVWTRGISGASWIGTTGSAVGIGAGILITAGLFRRTAATVLLLATLALLAVPGLRDRVDPVLLLIAGALLLTLTLTPSGEPLRIGPLLSKRPRTAAGARWLFPRGAAWTALAGGLTGIALLAIHGLLVIVLPFAVASDGDHAMAVSVAPGLTLAAACLCLLLGLNFARIFPPRPATGSDAPPLVFFDGICGLCNTAVDFILAEDHARIFRYAPIQGDTAARLLDPALIQNPGTMVYRDERGLHTRSDAILHIGLRLGGMWRISALGFLVPKAWRNRLYDTIARNRYRWFGQKDSCRMPTPAERELFLM
jgi:predicted DCC family thiol-disulfide oxidoreductase YuxK